MRGGGAVVGVLRDPAWGHGALLLRSELTPKLLEMGPASADATKVADLLCGTGTEQYE